MNPLRTDTGQEPQLGPARAWTRHGYGIAHVKHWVRGGEMRECLRSGCPVRFTTVPVCTCGIPTEPLQLEIHSPRNT